MQKSLFREKSMARASYPEQPDAGIQVVNPGVWMVLAAVCLFLASLLIWSMIGALDVITEEKGYSDGTSVYLFLDEEEVVYEQKGMEACVLEESGRVEAVSDIPVSYQEAAEFLGGEGMAHALLMTEGDWKYKVELSGIHVKKGVCHVRIVTERQKPISYFFE